MKLSFSTLGCPAWTTAQILAQGVQYGFDGVEIRGFGGETDLQKLREFTPEERKRTQQEFAAAGLEICCVDTSLTFASADPAERKRSIEATEWHAELAASLHSPYVRVFGGKAPKGIERAQCVEYMAEALAEAGRRAARHGVSVLIETHDWFTRGEDVAPVLERAACDGLGAIWDFRHSVHSGEALETTWDLIGKWVRHVHVKDETREGKMCAVGEGDVPVRECVALLQDKGFDGYLSLEWEKKWHPEIAEPEEVFPKYVTVMREYLRGGSQ